MKKLAFLIVIVAVVAGIGFQVDATPTPSVELQAQIADAMDATAFSLDGIESEVECSDDASNMGPSCEDKCQKKMDRCVRQGNGETYCFDNVFCECMCNTCNDCIC